jgi:hypothetical protein
LDEAVRHGAPPRIFSIGNQTSSLARKVSGWPKKMTVGPCIPVGMQLKKAAVGPTSGPTWRLSHYLLMAVYSMSSPVWHQPALRSTANARQLKPPSALNWQVTAGKRPQTTIAPSRGRKIHRVDPDFGSTLTDSNRDSQSNRWVNCKIMGQPCEFQVRAENSFSCAPVYFTGDSDYKANRGHRNQGMT